MGIEITPRVALADVNKQTNKLNNPTQVSHKTTPEASSDSVNLSVGNLLSNVDSAPVDNSARIEALKNKIESGNYTVDSHKLAGNIIRSERDLAPF